MRFAIFAALAAPLFAQPAIRTALLNGVTRASLLHPDTGLPVTDDSPAQPGGALILQGSGFGADVQVVIGASPADTTPIDGSNVQFTLPPDAAGSFVQVLAISGGASSNAATFPAAAADSIQLSAAEVQALVLNTALSADGPGLVVVISDRIGNPLAIYRRPGSADADAEKALSLARAGAFFSSQRTPLSSRTVRAISRVNFPEGIPNQPAGALYGIENTNRGCSFNTAFQPGQTVPQLLNSAGAGYSLGIATVAGGIPLFRDGQTVIGGIGVAGLASDDLDESAAAAGVEASGFFVHTPLPDPGAVFLSGFALPFLSTNPPTLSPASAPGGTFQIAPRNGAAAPEGWLVGPVPGSNLSVADVASIVQNAAATAALTRAAIRLPVGTRASMVIAVSDLDGTLLALYRMPDSTVFSLDVAVAKSRNVVYFSGPNLDSRDLPGVPAGAAVTNRTIGFGAQIYFPSGIWNTSPGPFYGLYQYDLANPCTQGHQPANPNQSGVVFFPGSAPLYRNGQLAGGLGVSGDGVEQDDFVTAAGAAGFEAPAALRADQIVIRGVHLPYWLFPRNPEQ